MVDQTSSMSDEIAAKTVHREKDWSIEEKEDSNWSIKPVKNIYQDFVRMS